MFKKPKKIKFISDRPDLEIPKPIPADRALPSWYKKMDRIAEDGHPTVKTCMPFVDGLMAGYIITLPADFTIDTETNDTRTASEVMINSDHHISQINQADIGDNYDPQPHKWVNNWYIKTPKGYSCLFIHPINREDLPFRSITGIVDTDKHPVIINFPFLMKKGFKGTVPAGTPIIQIIPFKRDDWKSDVSDDKEPKRYPRPYEINQPPFNWYKTRWWTRKIYK